MNFSELDILLKQILSGEVSLYTLPESLYINIAKELTKSLNMGFKGATSVAEFEKAYLYKQNLGRFAGAKTFQEVRELTAAAFAKDGAPRKFSEFRQLARDINERYNVSWLQAEQEAVIANAQSARQWLKIEGEKDLFPLLEYQTSLDDRVRPSHAALDGLTRSVNDPIWQRIMPPNGFRCRCIVIQHTADYPITPTAKADAQTAGIKAEFKKHGEFDMNAGTSEVIFKESGRGKHNYFNVPRQFSEQLKANFYLPNINDI